jgi:hypothetical protein
MGALVLAASSVRADESSTVDPDAARIASAGHSLTWNWTPPGRTDRFGHAETLIHAPLPKVRRMVLDFGHYRELAPYSVKTSRIVGHQPDGSIDVYMQISVMNDMVMLWNVTRFAPLRHVSDGLEVLEGKMIPGKGNVEDGAAVWTMHALGPEWTVLKFDLLLRPGIPAPQSAIDEELRNSASHAVDAIHDKAQGSRGIQAYAGRCATRSDDATEEAPKHLSRGFRPP